ncbi:MAG: YigZ family protein, partial [Campylobacterales bacterium]|nr:YigZ family protein [Campylobacterales bacterium]
IKLGTGGLVRAYSDSLNAVIGKSEIVQYKKLERIKKEILYKDISKFEYVIEKISLSVIEKNFNGDGGVYIVEGEKEKLDELAREI